MIFDHRTDETKLVHINHQFLEKSVWEKGKEKLFKLVGIHVDEQVFF